MLVKGATGRCGSNSLNVIFGDIVHIRFMSTSCEIALRWMPKNTFDYVNIGSGNGLVLSGNKTLIDSMLTQIYIAIWYHLTMSYTYLYEDI